MAREAVVNRELLQSVIRLAYTQGWIDAENKPEPKAVDVRPFAETYAEELAASLLAPQPKPRLEVVR